MDFAFLSLLLTGFGRPQSWPALLADCDTGWHIRTGDFIWGSGTVPLRDIFSFSRPGDPWFAWEWLSDVAFSLLHRWGGLAAVAVFSAIVLCLAAACLLSWLLRRGAGLWVAMAVMLAAVSASSVHALARPHIFSLLFVTIALWAVDEDRRRPSPRVWLLVPLSMVWANLHAGFIGWLAIAGFLVLVSAFERNWGKVRRYALLAGLSAAATLINPYGWKLHEHIVRYLGSSWILDHVQEFQSPNIRSESMIVFAMLLLAGLVLASRSFAREDWFEGSLVIVWAFAALRSARHIPLYAVAAAPLVASEAAACWSRVAGLRVRNSPLRIFWELGRDMGKSRHFSVWTPVLGATMLLLLPLGRSIDFPGETFPVTAVNGNLERLRPDPQVRILTTDQWADYLIFRFYPRQRVFFDGRSDFYGPGVGEEYRAIQCLGQGWRQAFDRYQFSTALLPVSWPLGEVLQHDPQWRLVYRDRLAILLVRSAPGLKENRGTAECIPVGDEANGHTRMDGGRFGRRRRS